MGNSNYDIRNKIFTYVKHSADITDQVKEIYESSLIFIGDEQQIYVPIIDTYVGVGKSKYDELANSFVWIPSEGSYSITTKYGDNRSLGTYSISSGRNTVAIGDVSFASGINTIASGEGSHTEGYGNLASGKYSHAEGENTQSSANATHAEGENTIASAAHSHAEGYGTESSGNNSHSEGNYTKAQGNNSHSEGNNTVAAKPDSHAEGNNTNANGNYSHAEGQQTNASGNISHTEGSETKATQNSAHAEGKSTTASGLRSHAEGWKSEALGENSHAEGNNTKSTENSSHSEGESTTASGNSSHSEGKSTTASGNSSHSEGEGTNASAVRTHTEGYHTTASNQQAHAEGFWTVASGDNSHTEGKYTYATNSTAHAEGYGTYATNKSAHSEGYYTYAEGINSHVEGDHNHAFGDSSHAEGSYTYTIGIGSHAEGSYSYANGNYSHTEGSYTYAIGINSHAEGYYTYAQGIGAHAEGNTSYAYGLYSHTEGAYSYANGDYSHAEGDHNNAYGNSSHAEGRLTSAIGKYSHAEGYNTQAHEYASHVEGAFNSAESYMSHAEGIFTSAIGKGSHAEGGIPTLDDDGLLWIQLDSAGHDWRGGQALGDASHAEGLVTYAYGDVSHTEGIHTQAWNEAEHAEGKWNKSNTGTISSIGIGTSESARKNAFEVLTNGNAYLYGVGNYTGDNLDSSKSLQEVINRSITQNGTVNNSGSHVINNISINSYGDLSYTYHNLSGSDSGNFLTGYTQSADGKISVSKGTFTTSGHNKTSEQNYVVTYTYIDSTGKIHYDYRDLSGTDSGNFVTGYTQTKDGKISVSKGTFTYAGTDKGTTAQSHVITDLNIDSTGKISYNYRNLSGSDSGNFLTGFSQTNDGKVTVSKGTFTNSYLNDGKSNIISYTSSSPLKTVSYTYIDSTGKVHQTYNSIYIDPVNDFKYHDLGITQVTYQGDENFVYALTGVSTSNGNATSHTIAYQISGLPTKKYVDDQFRANDALRYCGTVTPSTNPNGTITFTHTTGTHPGHSTPDYDAGAVYKVNSTGYIFSERVSAGDMMISYWDNDLNRNLSIDGWNIINQNIDLRTISPENKYFNNSKSEKVLTGVYLTNDGTLSYSYYSLSVKTNTDKYTAASEVENNGAQNILRNGGNKRGLKVLTGVSLNQNGLETEISYSYTYLYSEQQHHSTEGSAGPSIGIGNNGTKVITEVNLSADGKLTYMYNTISIDESSHANSSVGLDSVVRTGDTTGVITNLYVDSNNQNKLTYTIKNLSVTTSSTAATSFGGNDFYISYVSNIQQLSDGKITYNSGIAHIDYPFIFSSKNGANGGASSAILKNSGNIAKGAYSIAEGQYTLAFGDASHAEGSSSSGYDIIKNNNLETLSNVINTWDTISKFNMAYGFSSHSEGKDNISGGSYSHSEGLYNIAFGSYSHASGKSTWAGGDASTTEGISTKALGYASHAEGFDTTASGDSSHSEGKMTLASGTNAHAEGSETSATYNNAHAEGYQTLAKNIRTHAEGSGTIASGEISHAEGYDTVAKGNVSHAEGLNTTANGNVSHTEGHATITGFARDEGTGNRYIPTPDDDNSLGHFAHAEGNATTAYSANTHAEGRLTFAKGLTSHAEGNETISSGETSHAEGNATISNGVNSHTEGLGTITHGNNSHAEGRYSQTGENAHNAHAEGQSTQANGNSSHTEGYNTQTYNTAEHAEGKYNKSTQDKTLSSIGIGTSDTDRKNAFEVLINGNAYLFNVGNYVGNNLDSSTPLQEVINNGIQTTYFANINDKIYLGGTKVNTNGIISYTYYTSNTYTTNGAFYTSSAIIGGNCDISGNLIVNGNTTIGNASTDSITLNAASITLSNNTKFTNLSNLWGSV